MQHRNRTSQIQTNCASLSPAQRRKILAEAFRLIINAHRRSLEAEEPAPKTHDAGRSDSTHSAGSKDLVSASTPEPLPTVSTVQEVTS